MAIGFQSIGKCGVLRRTWTVGNGQDWTGDGWSDFHNPRLRPLLSIEVHLASSTMARGPNPGSAVSHVEVTLACIIVLASAVDFQVLA